MCWCQANVRARTLPFRLGVRENSLPLTHTGYQVSSDRLGLIANGLAQ